MSAQHILLTGATGGIGNEVIRQLSEKVDLANITAFMRDSKSARKIAKKYPKLNVVYGDITDAVAVAEVCKNKDVVIHLAAVIPTQEYSNKGLIDAVNIGGTTNIVRGMEANAPNAFLLYSSSVATYGDRIKDPDIRVGDAFRGDKKDLYCNSKIAAEKIIQDSKLNWSIFRLAAIMGIGNHKINPLMFYMPLDTPMEYATVDDTARAFVHALDHLDELNHHIFNLGGGKECLLTYKEFLSRAFNCYGMGKVDFPKYAFANQGFHCGYYADGDELENILHFRKDTNESYFKQFHASVPGIQRFFTQLVNKPVKKWLLTKSDPYRAHKKKDETNIEFFFGDSYQG